jgi:pimeloyl-ACP methyl ester carboxylesterase
MLHVRERRTVSSFGRNHAPFFPSGLQKSVALWLVLSLAFSSAEGMAESVIPHGTIQSVVQPEQPASGPGSREYRFASIHSDRIGRLPIGVTVFQPDGIDEATRDDLPVVVFLHGFTAIQPQRYGGWIEHLVKRGAVVIYPDYQDAGIFAGDQDRYADDMFTGIASGLDALGLTPARVHVVGHSLGAVLTMVYGTLAPERGLPSASSLTMVTPGGCRNCGNALGFGVPVRLDRRLPEDTLISIVVGEDDDLVGSSDALALSRMVTNIPPDRRRFVMVRSDDHGRPPLVADHLFPQTAGAGGEEDALDWYGLWRPFDAIVSCAEVDQDCDTAVGTSGAALAMGSWSDGTPVASPTVQDTTQPR